MTSHQKGDSRNSRSVKQILNTDIFPELEKSCLSFSVTAFFFLRELFKYTVSVLPFSVFFIWMEL